MSAPEECANCGAELARGAKVCRECGADESTGLRESEATRYDGLDLPSAAFEDAEVEAPKKGKTVNGLPWYWWAVATLLLLLLVLTTLV